MRREIHLSAKQPLDANSKIQLVTVADDLTTTIRLSSGEMLSGKPSDYFRCDQFGNSGLQLLSASHETGSAIFQRMWSETK
jgi:hypothetical protein